jgi:hypothetical protein
MASNAVYIEKKTTSEQSLESIKKIEGASFSSFPTVARSVPFCDTPRLGALHQGRRSQAYLAPMLPKSALQEPYKLERTHMGYPIPPWPSHTAHTHSPPPPSTPILTGMHPCPGVPSPPPPPPPPAAPGGHSLTVPGSMRRLSRHFLALEPQCRSKRVKLNSGRSCPAATRASQAGQ